MGLCKGKLFGAEPNPDAGGEAEESTTAAAPGGTSTSAQKTAPPRVARRPAWKVLTAVARLPASLAVTAPAKMTYTSTPSARTQCEFDTNSMRTRYQPLANFEMPPLGCIKTNLYRLHLIIN